MKYPVLVTPALVKNVRVVCTLLSGTALLTTGYSQQRCAAQ